jgi:hypothetical protein
MSYIFITTDGVSFNIPKELINEHAGSFLLSVVKYNEDDINEIAFDSELFGHIQIYLRDNILPHEHDYKFHKLLEKNNFDSYDNFILYMGFEGDIDHIEDYGSADEEYDKFIYNDIDLYVEKEVNINDSDMPDMCNNCECMCNDCITD